MSTIPNSAPGAAPFTMINPSGQEAGQSINTIAAVGASQRQGGGGGGPNSKDRKLDREQRERGMQQEVQLTKAQMEQQKQQFEAQQKLEEEQLSFMRQQQADEADYRMMSESLSDRALELQVGLEQINRDLADAQRMGDNIRESELDEIRTQYEEKVSKINRQLTGANLLKTSREGLFKRDAAGQKGGSIGANVLTTLLGMAEGKTTLVRDINETLVPYINDLNAKMTLGQDVNPAMFADMARTIAGMLPAQEGVKPEDVQKKLASLFNNAYAAARGTTGMRKGPVTGEEATKAASEVYKKEEKSLGSFLLGAVTPKVADPEGARARAEKGLGQPVEGEAPIDMGVVIEAMRGDYQELLGMGVDKDTLGLIIRSMKRDGTAAAASTLTTGQEGTAEMQAKGEAKTQPQALAKMVGLMTSNLNLSTGDFYNLRTGEPENWVRDMVIDMMSKLAGANSPEELIGKLTSGVSDGFQKGTIEAKVARPDAGTPDDPTDDLHPEVRKVLLKELQKGAAEIRQLREQEGIDDSLPTTRGELEALLTEETSNKQRKEADVRARSRKAGEHNRADAKAKADAGRKALLEDRKKERSAYAERSKKRASPEESFLDDEEGTYRNRGEAR
jgi:hypothetical protein